MKYLLFLYIMKKSNEIKRGEINMIFKVYYQVNALEVPIRENTQTLYIKGESVRDVRQKLKKEPFNVEYVAEIKGAYLEYEKLHEDYKVLEL